MTVRKQPKLLTEELLKELKSFVGTFYRPLSGARKENRAKRPGSSFLASAALPDEELCEAPAFLNEELCEGSAFPKEGYREKPAFPKEGYCEGAAFPKEELELSLGKEPYGSELDDALNRLDESFTEMLLRKIDEKAIRDSECYKKAFVNRKLFSKIRSDRLYRPSKQTVIAFIFALELSLPEAKDMLKKAGFALSNSSKFDVIVTFFIEKKRYDLFELNDALLYYDQPLINVS